MKAFKLIFCIISILLGSGCLRPPNARMLVSSVSSTEELAYPVQNCVSLKEYMIHPSFSLKERKLIERAIFEWNRVTAPTVCLRPVNADEGGFNEILIIRGSCPDNHAVGCYQVYNFIVRKIILTNPNSYELFYEIVMHELGHSLDLPHSSDTWSYMNPVAYPAWDVYVPEADVKLFHSIYH